MVWVVKTLGVRLESAGYQVSVAVNGKEGLEKVERECPDLMILDVILQDLNGYQICKLLKADARFQKMPIVLLTAPASAKDEKQGYESGADLYFCKPFQSQELLVAVETLIRKT